MKKIYKSQMMNRDATISPQGKESFEIKKGDLLVKEGASIFKIEKKDISKFLDKKSLKRKSGFWHFYEEEITEKPDNK